MNMGQKDTPLFSFTLYFNRLQCGTVYAVYLPISDVFICRGTEILSNRFTTIDERGTENI